VVVAEDAQLQLTLVSLYLLEDEGLAIMMLFVLVISHHPQVFFLLLFAKTYTICISVGELVAVAPRSRGRGRPCGRGRSLAVVNAGTSTAAGRFGTLSLDIVHAAALPALTGINNCLL